MLWKGIKSLVNLKQTNKKDISIIDKNGRFETDPIKIANSCNQHVVNRIQKIKFLIVMLTILITCKI